MIKKIVSLLCLLSLIATFIPGSYVFAKETEAVNEKAVVLAVLGIKNTTASGVVTNDYILTALSGFLYGETEKPSAENFARDMGILEFGEIYDGAKSITKSEAVEYALATLGYIEYAKSTGENGVRTVASSLGVTRGLGTIGDEVLSIDECIVMLHNMLEIAPMAAIYGEGEVKHIIEGDQTLLSKYRDVHKIYGILTSNGITSLDKEAGCAEGYIQIGTALYAVEDSTPYSDLLGKNVEAYVIKDEPYEPIVVYLGERAARNQELVIDPREIKEVASDYSKIEYYENNRVKKAKIADVPKVIYNGVFYGEYTVADFKPDSGNLRLVDNNGDGKYDVIFITSYETIIVDGVDTHNKVIYNKYKSEGNLPSVSLDTESEDVKYTIKDILGEVELSDIKKFDILSVAKSKPSTNVVIEILVSNDTFVGMLQRIDERYMEIFISDEKYLINNSFLRFKNEEGNINLGNTYTFFVDALGNVVYCEKVAEDGYAVMQRAYVDWENEIIYASYMNLSGVWVDSPIAKKITVNETLYKNWEVAYDVLKDIKGQLVKITFNNDGEIKKIETATETTEYDKNRFTITPKAQYTWRSGVKALGDVSTYQFKYFVEDDAKLVIIPEDYQYKEGYEVRDPMAYFHADVNYKISLCDIDEYGFSGLMVIKYEPQIKSTLFIVSKISTILVYGEACSQVTGYAGDFENITLTGKDDTVFGDVQKGDIIKVSLNSEGYVDSYSKVFNLSDFSHSGATQYQSQAYMAGDVIAVDAGKGRMAVDINGSKHIFRIDDTVTVQTYNEIEGLERTNIYSILAGNKVFIDTTWGNVKQMIIMR